MYATETNSNENFKSKKSQLLLSSVSCIAASSAVSVYKTTYAILIPYSLLRTKLHTKLQTYITKSMNFV